MNGMEKKTELIKQLILHQRKLNPSATSSLPSNLDSVPMLMLWDRPEATILNIVQTYNICKRKGDTDSSIIKQLIEIDGSFPSNDSFSNHYNSGNNIVDYIFFRLKKDYPLLAKYFDKSFVEYSFQYIASQTGYPNYLRM